jgi:hypothetical protein
MACYRMSNWAFGVVLSAASLAMIASGCDDDKNADSGDHDHDHDSDTSCEEAPSGDGGEHEHSHDPSVLVGPVTGATCPSDSTLTYANFGQQFMQNYCLRCHSETLTCDQRMGAPSDHNFDQLAEIDLLSPHIDEYAGSGPSSTNTHMPPSDPKPSMTDRQKLSEWIACGTPGQ